MDFDQNQELVHFGKLTPSHNGRIPEMQMPVFSSTFMFSASGRGRGQGTTELGIPCVTLLEMGPEKACAKLYRRKVVKI